MPLVRFVLVFLFALVASSGLAQTQSPDTLKGESYGVYGIGDGQVDGVVQVREMPEGTAEFVLTLNGLVPGDLHAAGLYEGSCAPEQAIATKLETVGDSVPEDPFVSITTTDLPYETVVTGNYFVMVYGPSLDTPALACGEVGVGANRSDLGRATNTGGANQMGEGAANLSQPEQRLVERAKMLVASETGVAAAGLTLASLEPVEWRDASLGCPQPGTMYAQVITPGYQLMLRGPDGESYDVHTASAPDGNIVLCRQAETSVKKLPVKSPPVMNPPMMNLPVTNLVTDFLVGTVWQWQTERLEDASNYTIEFLPDGYIAIQADCNRGRASFETFGENGLRIDAPAMTRAACPPGSLDGAFLEQVVSSSSYAFDGEDLVLYPVVDPGTMYFTPVSSAGATGGGTSEGEMSGRLTGTVTYRERIALLPGSVVRVTLQDVSRADAPAEVVDSQTVTTSGENVPIPFTLTYDPMQIDPRHRYTVRAEIRDGAGGLLWTSDTAYSVLTGGAPSDAVDILVRRVSDPTGGMPPSETDQTFEFTCTPPGEVAFTFTVKTGPGEVGITLPERFGGRNLVLPQVRAASGARFEEGGVTFWNQGDEALLQVGSQTFEGCVERAEEEGGEVIFRATGTEPFWRLELTEENLRFYDVGEQEVVVPASAPETDEATGITTYHAVGGAYDLRVSLDETTCTDAMNGFTYEVTVTVTLGSDTFQGCGRRLER